MEVILRLQYTLVHCVLVASGSVNLFVDQHARSNINIYMFLSYFICQTVIELLMSSKVGVTQHNCLTR